MTELENFIGRLYLCSGTPPAVAEHAGGIDERSIEERVERIVEDLGANRVIPKQIDKLEEAVRRSRVSQSVFRATRNR